MKKKSKAKKVNHSLKYLKKKILKILQQKSFTKREIADLKRAWKKPDSRKTLRPARLVTQRELCMIIDKVPGTINKWNAKSKGIFRHRKDGSKVWFYDLADIFDWRVKYEQKLLDDEIADLEDQIELLRKEGTSSRDKYWEEKARKEKIERENAEVAQKIHRGQIVMLGDVMNDWVEVGNIINTAAMGAIKENPDHAAVIIQIMEVAAEEIKDRIKRIQKMNPDQDLTIFNQIQADNEDGECGYKKPDGTYCKYAAKKEGLCLIHWKKVKGGKL